MVLPTAATLYRDRRVAVLGAAGFIGRWIARALVRCGARMYLFVRHRRAAERVFSGLGVEGEILELDLRDWDSLASAFAQIRPAITFNLAGYGVKHSEQDQAAAWRLNAELAGRVCQIAATAQDKTWPGQHLIHGGSALEYGPFGTDFAEDSVAQPTTVYGQTKLAGTLYIEDCQRRHEFRVVVARMFTVYGPGEHPGRLLPSLLAGAREKRPIPLSAGDQKRDFVYVEDVAEALLRLGGCAARPYHIVNVATGLLTSVRGFVEAAAAALGIPAEHLKFGALETRFPESEHGDVSIEKLHRLTGWTPPTRIPEGIYKTIQHEHL
jgi:nucleoside-diphosphate-sugar epimerase